MQNIHWFISEEDCKQFFSRMAKNNCEELTHNFVFEGNSSMKYGWVVDLSNIVGFEGLGVLQQDYEDEEITFIEDFFIKPVRNVNPSNVIRSVEIHADDIEMMPDGTISLWWD